MIIVIIILMIYVGYVAKKFMFCDCTYIFVMKRNGKITGYYDPV